MHCAICRGVGLRMITLELGLSAHRCPQCNGHWITSTAYRDWLKQNGPTLAALPTEHHQPTVQPFTAKRCPESGHILLPYRIRHDISFTLDHCGQCNGVWFDEHTWDILKQHHLHTQVHRMFGPHWQRQVWLEERRRTRDAINTQRLGVDAYAEIKRVKEWIDTHPQRIRLLAYLNDPDPLKP